MVTDICGLIISLRMWRIELQSHPLHGHAGTPFSSRAGILLRAAAEMERLWAENAALREALDKQREADRG